MFKKSIAVLKTLIWAILLINIFECVGNHKLIGRTFINRSLIMCNGIGSESDSCRTNIFFKSGTDTLMLMNGVKGNNIRCVGTERDFNTGTDDGEQFHIDEGAIDSGQYKIDTEYELNGKIVKYKGSKMSAPG